MTDLPLGGLPTPNTGKPMRFTDTTIPNVGNEMITEQIVIGLPENGESAEVAGRKHGVTFLRQLGLIPSTKP
jgi:hypothetical protein